MLRRRFHCHTGRTENNSEHQKHHQQKNRDCQIPVGQDIVQPLRQPVDCGAAVVNAVQQQADYFVPILLRLICIQRKQRRPDARPLLSLFQRFYQFPDVFPSARRYGNHRYPKTLRQHLAIHSSPVFGELIA